MKPHPRQPTYSNHATNACTRETRAKHRHCRAFTIIELLVVLVIVIILLGMVIPMPSGHSYEKARRIKCVNNLKNVGLAFRIYANDSGGRFPWQIPGEKAEIQINYSTDPTTYMRAVTNELSIPKIVNCPSDKREVATNWSQFSRANMSYFITADASQTFPQSFLAGDRNITNENGQLLPGLHDLSTNGPTGWDETIHKNQGNACMGDGSVQQLSGARLREQLRNTGQTNKYIKLSVP